MASCQIHRVTTPSQTLPRQSSAQLAQHSTLDVDGGLRCAAMRCDGRIQQCHKITQYVMSCHVMITHTYTYTYWNGQDMLSGVRGHSDKYATGHFPEAQCAFKILMIHEVLQFALRIAFRCVLHRCGNLDIRC